MTLTLQALASIDPATGETVGEVPVTAPAQIDERVARARDAQVEWRRLSAEERGHLLTQGGERLVEQSDELGHLLTREMGKPLREGVGEVKSCGAGMREFVQEVADAVRPDALEDDHTTSTIFYDPFGVCAAISPWNFPIAMPHSMVVPALVAGNTVIVKPSEETPLIAQAYVDALNAFLPPHVLQIVHGADEQGKALVASDVDLIAFTGSRETGKKIMASAAGGLKRVILELGGKDPMIVLRDADLKKAARFAAVNSFRNAGQVCVSTERIYVDESVAEDFAEELALLLPEFPVGNGTAEGTRVGPMINARQKQHVVEQIDLAVKSGAKVVAGGGEANGNFMNPVILSGLDSSMDIMREETFGPVACLSTFKNEEDAVRLANDTPFGLGAVVFGEDESRALEVARGLDAGMIGVNKGCGGADGSPWVGAKQSGYGYHSSRDGHRQFTQVRVVSLPKRRPRG